MEGDYHGKVEYCRRRSVKRNRTYQRRENSAVALIPATILANSEVTIEGLPEISDIETLRDLLKEIGGNVHFEKEKWSSTLPR